MLKKIFSYIVSKPLQLVGYVLTATGTVMLKLAAKANMWNEEKDTEEKEYHGKFADMLIKRIVKLKDIIEDILNIDVDWTPEDDESEEESCGHSHDSETEEATA